MKAKIGQIRLCVGSNRLYVVVESEYSYKNIFKLFYLEKGTTTLAHYSAQDIERDRFISESDKDV
jgi:hypothetical protein